jgi:hypothetical protein
MGLNYNSWISSISQNWSKKLRTKKNLLTSIHQIRSMNKDACNKITGFENNTNERIFSLLFEDKNFSICLFVVPNKLSQSIRLALLQIRCCVIQQHRKYQVRYQLIFLTFTAFNPLTPLSTWKLTLLFSLIGSES